MIPPSSNPRALYIRKTSDYYYIYSTKIYLKPDHLHPAAQPSGQTGALLFKFCPYPKCTQNPASTSTLMLFILDLLHRLITHGQQHHPGEKSSYVEYHQSND